ncbi:MAG: sulfotransferase [Verrucomicrobiae bacterium]|nr:sulfotransferase [Verrucomicrobiae bacterium]NNJ43706.1 sulfotransferase [Akkermansiaceae bacterium]
MLLKFKKNRQRPVFVIGTGRSGTHWLGFSLGGHPEVRATVEVDPMFKLSTKMALNESLEGELYGSLVKAYKKQLLKSGSKLYVDKTHPNIWIAEKLKETFPRALFVGIERNPYATVASMLKHKSVSAWHRRWKEYPVPNRFLGITEKMADRYDDIPLASQCAIRWVAHHQRMNQLRSSLADDLSVISYEDFAYDAEETILKLQKFLGLHEPIPVPKVKTESLRKWRANLSDENLSQIEDIVGFPPHAIEGLPGTSSSL